MEWHFGEIPEFCLLKMKRGRVGWNGGRKNINKCRSTVGMWRKHEIDAGCKKIDNNDNEEDDDGNTSANATVTKNDCLLVAQTKRNSTQDEWQKRVRWPSAI